MWPSTVFVWYPLVHRFCLADAHSLSPWGPNSPIPPFFTLTNHPRATACALASIMQHMAKLGFKHPRFAPYPPLESQTHLFVQNY
eukprot:1143650-Pelagomonas_calceolata.AAC.5